MAYNKDPHGRPYWLLQKRNKAKRCEYCKVELTRTTGTIDHRTPKNWGGDYSPDNVAITCHSCNKLKGGEMTATTFIHLLKTIGVKGIEKLKDDSGLDRKDWEYRAPKFKKGSSPASNKKSMIKQSRKNHFKFKKRNK